MAGTEKPRRRKPPVDLEHSDAVYDFYLRQRRQPLRAKAICSVMANRYRPRVQCSPETRQALLEAFGKRVPVVIAINHLTERDPFVVAGAAWAGPLKPAIGHAQTLGKDQLFQGFGKRALMEAMGGIPVFRGKDHGIRATNAAAQRLIDVCAARLAEGDNMVVFPEGTCNHADARTVQAVGSGLGHIIFRAAKLGAAPVVVPVGLSYGEDANPRGASVWIGAPVTDLPVRPLDISRLIKSELQEAVDLAVKHY